MIALCAENSVLIKLFVTKAGEDKQKAAHSLRQHFLGLEKYEKEIRSREDTLEDVCSWL